MPDAHGNVGKLGMRRMSILMATPTLDEEVKKKLSPIYILAFLYFNGPLNKEKIQELIKERLFKIARFRSKVTSETVNKKTSYYYQELDTDSIPMDSLLSEIDAKTQAELDEFCSNVYGEPLLPNLPLWRAYIANNMSDGRSLLLWVIDHSIGDGPALISALMSIMDEQEKAVKVPQPRPQKKVGCWAAFKSACSAGFNVFIGDNCIPADPPSKLKVKDHRNPGCDRALSQSKGLDLQRVQEVKNIYPNATINDVLLANVCLTLREYFMKYEPGVLKKKQKFRANFPVSVRNKEEQANVTCNEHFGNRFSSGICSFPIHLDDPVEILWNIKRQFDAVKMSPEPILRDKLVGVLATSKMRRVDIVDLVLDMYGKVSAMLSNTAGPQQTVYFGGQAIDDICFYCLAPIGVYFGIVSYKGKISCGVSVSQACEPNAGSLSSLWENAFEKLYSATLDRAKAGLLKSPETSCCG